MGEAAARDRAHHGKFALAERDARAHQAAERGFVVRADDEQVRRALAFPRHVGAQAEAVAFVARGHRQVFATRDARVGIPAAPQRRHAVQVRGDGGVLAARDRPAHRPRQRGLRQRLVHHRHRAQVGDHLRDVRIAHAQEVVRGHRVKRAPVAADAVAQRGLERRGAFLARIPRQVRRHRDFPHHLALELLAVATPAAARAHEMVAACQRLGVRGDGEHERRRLRERAQMLLAGVVDPAQAAECGDRGHGEREPEPALHARHARVDGGAPAATRGAFMARMAHESSVIALSYRSPARARASATKEFGE